MNENIPQENTVKLSKAEKWKAYYEANKKKRSELNKVYRGKNKETLKVRRKAYCEANKDYFKAYREANKANHREYQKTYQKYLKERMQTDDLYCAKVKLSWAVVGAFRRRKHIKPSSSTITSILGCSWEEAKQHFEKKFQPGMSWANHGEWHIDHIVPIATATTLEEVVKLNHISNLQPLWAEYNLFKSCKMPHDFTMHYICGRATKITHPQQDLEYEI